MNINTSLQAFNNTTNDLNKAAKVIQDSFNQASNEVNNEEYQSKYSSTKLISAFIDEDLLANFAAAQLKTIQTENEVQDTLLSLKK